MSGSDRGKHSPAGLIWTALVAVVAVAAYWAMFYDMGYQSGKNERKANVEAEHYADYTANQIDRECSTKTGQPARECIAEIVKAERESQRSESDLAAQWKAANWVMWAGILAGAQLLATAFGLYFVKRTLDATLKAVEDTGKATKAMERQNDLAANAQRAWLSFTLKVTKIVQDGSIGLYLDITVTNHSNFPAHHVRAAAHGNFGRSWVLGAFSGRDDRPFVESLLGVTSNGTAIFPKEPGEIGLFCYIDDPDDLISNTDAIVTVAIGLRYSFEGGEGTTLMQFTLFGVHAALNAQSPIRKLLSNTSIL